jgi:RNA polymerase sigma-70 factor (ECF subfamily)
MLRALQEALIRAWRDLGALRDVEKIDAWLSRLVVRACLDEARRRRRWAMAPHVPWLREGRSDAPSIDERERLGRALGRLSPEHRVVLALRFYLDLGLAEIAEATGSPLGTVKSRLHYGLNEMRAALAADERAVAAALQETVR